MSPAWTRCLPPIVCVLLAACADDARQPPAAAPPAERVVVDELVLVELDQLEAHLARIQPHIGELRAIAVAAEALDQLPMAHIAGTMSRAQLDREHAAQLAEVRQRLAQARAHLAAADLTPPPGLDSALAEPMGRLETLLHGTHATMEQRLRLSGALFEAVRANDRDRGFLVLRDLLELSVDGLEL